MKLFPRVISFLVVVGVFVALPVFAFHDSVGSYATNSSLLSQAFRIPQLAFPLVVVAGLKDGASICTFAVMLVITALMMSYTHNRRKALHYAFTFISTIGIVYFLIGAFATQEIENFISSSQFFIAHDIFSFGIASIMFVFGLLNLQDYFFGKKLWFDAQARQESSARAMYHSQVIIWSAVKGIFAAPLLFVCTLPSYTHASLELKKSLSLPMFLSYEALYVFMTTIPLLLMLVAMIYVATHMERHDIHSGKHTFLKIVKGLFQIGAALLLLYIEL